VPTGRWVRKRRSSLRCFVESCLAIGDGLANECDCIWVQTVPRTRDRLTVAAEVRITYSPVGKVIRLKG
jgi:hypothetical protein